MSLLSSTVKGFGNLHKIANQPTIASDKTEERLYVPGVPGHREILNCLYFARIRPFTIVRKHMG